MGVLFRRSNGWATNLSQKLLPILVSSFSVCSLGHSYCLLEGDIFSSFLLALSPNPSPPAPLPPSPNDPHLPESLDYRPHQIRLAEIQFGPPRFLSLSTQLIKMVPRDFLDIGFIDLVPAMIDGEDTFVWPDHVSPPLPLRPPPLPISVFKTNGPSRLEGKMATYTFSPYFP